MGLFFCLAFGFKRIVQKEGIRIGLGWLGEASN